MFNLSDKIKRRVTLFSVSLFLVINFLSLGFAHPAHAAASGSTVAIGADIPRAAERIERGFVESLTAAGLGALMNSVTYFVQRIAYDAAVAIASGSPGQSPSIFTTNPAKYLGDVALDSVGELVHSLGEPFGLNLCGFPDIQLQAFIQIGLRDIYGVGAPQQNCSWQQLRQGWSKEAFNARYGPLAEQFTAEKFNDALSVRNSDFGVSMGALLKIDKLQVGAQLGAQLERLEGDGVKAVKDLITGNINTPAQNIKEDLSLLTAKDIKQQTVTQIAGLYAAELPQLFPMAAGVFLNTLASELLKKALGPGLFPSGGDFSPNQFGIVRQNRLNAQNAFTFLLTPSVGRNDSYDIVSRFATCPNSPGLDNCVIDQKFAAAINRARQGTPLTIQQAIDEGLLDGNKPLISPRRESDNTDPECYQKGYCYSNIQKLRKARILPLGFEIAALKADPDQLQGWTLQTVINGFHSCAPNGLADAQFPFCRLINPNWVLKAPTARCTAEVTGPQLLGDFGSSRRTECVDFETCLNEGPNGECLDDQFGFCTQEENTWTFAGDSCPAQFATCKKYLNTQGKEVAYLSRTLDFAQCSAGDVGCLAFSLERTAANNEWIASPNITANLKTFAIGRNQVVHLNGNVKNATCSSNSAGCTAFYPAQKNDLGQYVLTTGANQNFQKDTSVQPTYLKKAPDYLGCYDANPNTPQIEWPQNQVDLTTGISTNAACQNFASACIASEVGCQGYRPEGDSNAPQIPGVIGSRTCSEQCVGYSTYRQEATNFEASVFPLNIIPANGTQCSAQHVGCDEFTNLESSGQGGERLEYFTNIRYCERPNGQNERAFFSWEGSISEGFVLKSHRLVPVDQARFEFITSLRNLNLPGTNAADEFPVGSPAYVNDSRAAIERNYALCNEARYNVRLNNPLGIGLGPNDVQPAPPNCVAMFDDEGNTYYRLVNETMTTSNSCNRLRKTNSSLEIDQDLTAITTVDPRIVNGQNRCEQRGGLWADAPNDNLNQPVCQRCIGGGVYVNGDCVYQADREDNGTVSCPAAANGCRQYVGNTGNNVRQVFIDEFEPQGTDPNALIAARNGWTTDPAPADFNVASESLIPGQNSLRVGPGVQALQRELVADTLKRGSLYEVSFWIRGAPQILRVEFWQNNASQGDFTVNPTTGQEERVGVGLEWRQFTLGPIQFGNVDPVTGIRSGDVTADSVIRISRGQFLGGVQGDFFIDNVRFTEVQDLAYVIKNSWRDPVTGAEVPAACDATPNDGRPGAALGCLAYEDTNDQTRYATGFDRLCREEAIGCEPFYDTHNTLKAQNANFANAAELPLAYNMWCVGAAGRDCTISVAGTDYTCRVPGGANGCYIVDQPMVVPTGTQLPPNAQIRPSTILIPADTPSEAPIFLANRPDFSCQSRDQGCTEVGEEQQILPNRTDAAAYRHTRQFIRNNPDEYIGDGGAPGTLCTSEAVGCQQFRSGQANVFFKDPTRVGGTTCSYFEEKNVNGQIINGWFLDGVGQCSNDNNQTCRQDTDCGQGNTCINQGSVACYRNFVRQTAAGVVFDIRSNGSQAFANRAGVCNVRHDQCTEFIDRADVSNLYPGGKPYYALFNDKLREQVDECNGQASLNEGCVLFDQTDNPNKLYNAQITYRQSENATPPFSAIAPVPGGTAFGNDSNIILKVQRDRQCAEWLHCRSSIDEVQDDGSVKSLCYDYRACNESDGNTCTNWVGQNEYSLNRLTENQYITRGVSWYDEELSGYSLFNRFQINDLRFVAFNFQDNNLNFSQADQDRLRPLTETTFAVYPRETSRAECRPATQGQSTNWRICGPDQGGRCFGGQCLYPHDGVFDRTIPDGSTAANAISANDIIRLLGGLEGGTCKAFPEADSPFPNSTEQTVLASAQATDNPLRTDPSPGSSVSRRDFDNFKPGFENANVCQSGNCSCQYEKRVYRGGVTDYWAHSAQGTRPSGVCLGGQNDGTPCTPATPGECTNGGGICQPLERKETHVGLQGLCLEYDNSRPINGRPENNEVNREACLTWLPIDVSASTVDIFNSNLEAGYFPDLDARVAANSPSNGRFYCAAGTSVEGVIGDNRFFAGGVATYNNLRTTLFGPANSQSTFLSTSPIVQGRNQPNLGGSRWNCDNNIGVPYVTLFCRPNPLEIDTYQTMQTWAWESIGENATVLRVETKDRDTRANTEGSGGNDWTGFRDDGGNTNVVNHLFSRPVRGNGNLGNHGWGMVMHPPRIFDTNFNYNNPNQISYNRTDPGGAGFVSAPMFAPGNDYIRAGNDADSTFVDRFPVEEAIRENDLDRVYFVPLAYPGTADGVHPTLLAKDFFIDFTAIKQNTDDQGNPTNANVISDVVYGWDASGGAAVNGSTFQDFVTENCITQPDCAGGSDLDYYARTGSAVWSYRQTINGNANDAVVRYFRNSPLRQYPRATGVPGLDTSAGSRNEVATRYVAVFITAIANDADEPGTTFPDWVRPTGTTGNAITPAPPTAVANDPFAINCRTREANGEENWFAVGMDFNSNGEFLGYVSKWCHISEEARADDYAEMGVMSAVIATFNNQCTQFAEVYDDRNATNPVNGSNKAWTQRTWQFGAQAHPTLALAAITKNGTQTAPFGSLHLNGEEADNINNLRNYSFIFPTENTDVGARGEADGIPYSCAETAGTALRWHGQRLVGFGNSCGALAVGTIPYSNIGTPPVVSGRSVNQAQLDIRQLFTRFTRYIDYNSVTATAAAGDFITSRPRNAQAPDINDAGLDVSGPGGPAGNQLDFPRIYSLNPATCDRQNRTGNQKCTPGEVNNFTVNGKNAQITDYNGDGRIDEDENNDRRPDAIIGVGTLPAFVQFFAHADDNRMPIRRVMVHWDEDPNDPSTIANQNTFGFYRNRKPSCSAADNNAVTVGLCGTAANRLTNMTCTQHRDCHFGDGSANNRAQLRCFLNGQDNTDNPGNAYTTARFGNSPRACEERPFQFSHTYTCSRQDVQRWQRDATQVPYMFTLRQALDQGRIRTDAELRLRGTYNIGDNDPICVFRPRVQVLDNWGWCNGVDAQTGAARGYWNDDGNAICDQVTFQSGWQPYAGEVIVVPVQQRRN